MEPSISAQETNVAPRERKKCRPLTLLLAFLAILGVAFGVYGMLRGNEKNKEISDLKTKVSALETAKTEEESQKGPFIKDGYFYVPYWGVKYKLSDELTGYGYSVDQENMFTRTKYVVSLTAVRKTDVATGGQTQSIDDVFTCSMVKARRETREYADSMRETMPTTTFVDFGTEYTFELTDETGFVGSCNVGSDEANKAAAEIILKEILSKPESI